MKVDRRSFLSFLIGGAAGTTISPLPWKLMDDSSIWTQMWPWTPVPEDGEASYVNSACTLCPGGCGITVRNINDRAVKIEGMKGHPVNDGRICIMGLSGLQLLYGPARVKTPLKRVGERGQRRWEQISWNDAISEVAKTLKDLRANDQSHTVGCISSSDRGTIPLLFDRLLNVYGSPNFIRTPSLLDTYELTLYLMQGAQALPGFDLENADYVLSFGSGIIDGWGSPVRMFRAHSAWRNAHTKIVQIEPRLSNTAAKSDRWVPIIPGTEAALALGIAHVIINGELYNTEFVNKQTAGFNEWKKQVNEKFNPYAVSQITGVDEITIAVLAREFAGASKPLAICGRGQGNTSGSLDEFIAVHALNALVGNINSHGGVWAVSDADYISWPAVEIDATAAVGMQKDRLDDAGSKRYPNTRYLPHRFVSALQSEEKYPLQALLVFNANPLYSMPDTKAVKKAFAKIPFVVSFSSYFDETAEAADLILPIHTYLETYEDVPSPVGLKKPVLGLTRPVVEPQFNTKHVGDIIIAIAKALGGRIAAAFPWDSYHACLKETLAEKWNPLMKQGFWVDPYLRDPDRGAPFDTLSGKFEFVNADIRSFPLFTPVGIEGNEADYPLLLIPYDSVRLINGFMGDPPFVIKTVEDTILKGKDVFVEINPKTAASYNLRQGQRAVLSTPKGKATVRVHLFEGIMPGIVALPRGLGHSADDKFLAGKGVNFNELIGPVEDPASGLDAAWGIRAKLSNA